MKTTTEMAMLTNLNLSTVEQVRDECTDHEWAAWCREWRSVSGRRHLEVVKGSRSDPCDDCRASHCGACA